MTLLNLIGQLVGIKTPLGGGMPCPELPGLPLARPAHQLVLSWANPHCFLSMIQGLFCLGCFFALACSTSSLSIKLSCRYDVELFQKIEALIGRKMETYPAEQEAVLMLLERVGEAQRIATMQVSW